MAPTQTLTKCRWPGETFDGEVSLEGEGYPFLLDTNSGEITPIAEYSAENGRTTVHVHLTKDDSTIVALAADPSRFSEDAPLVHVIEHDRRRCGLERR